MNNSSSMQVNQSLKKLTDNRKSIILVSCPTDNSLEKFSSLTELKNQNITIFIVIDLKQSRDIRMVKVDHNCHLFKQLLMFFFAQSRFFNFFSCSQNSCKFSSNFVNSSETPSSNLT